MGTRYLQLSLEDRCRIASLQAQGRSIRQIAADLDRAPSTIAREIRRNTGRRVGYKPAYADEQTRARRWKGSKLERDQALRQAVLDRLGQGWSPEQVAGRLAREQASPTVSHETIYRFIYAQIARTKDYSWRRYLPRAKSKRGWRGVRGGSSATFIEGRIPLAQRPAEASDRQTPGHWEADLMMFAKYGQAILTVHERSSRILLAARPDNKTANLIAELIEQLLRPSPPDCAEPSPSTTAPSSHATPACTASICKPSSATPTPPGRKAASKTPSAECDASSPAKPTSPPSQTATSPRSCKPTTQRPENASTSKHPPSYSSNTCCTSNVNPPPRLRGNDASCKRAAHPDAALLSLSPLAGRGSWRSHAPGMR